MSIDSPERLVNFVRENFPSGDYILEEGDGWIITDEWLVGTFAGRGFAGDTLADAARQMIDYLNKHIGDDSIVGRIATQSGWPNESAVKEFIATKGEDKSPSPLGMGVCH